VAAANYSSSASASAAGCSSWTCKGCGTQHPGFVFFCSSCAAVMEAEYGKTSHFELLGLPQSLDLDPKKLDEAYKALQRQLHPDRHAQASESERELVEKHAARLNEAVAVLRSPLRLASYWMHLHGVDVLQEEQRMQDAETMMEVMEVSEELGEAKKQSEVDQLISVNSGRLGDAEARLRKALGAADWDAARVLTERLQMLTRLRQRLNEWSPPS